LRELIIALELARILAGETPGCPVETKVAAAYVWKVNKVWYGDAEPQAIDIWVALNWEEQENPTPDAEFFVHPTDVKRMPFLNKMLQEWHCKDTTVRAYN